jgi:hypothetical protein
MSGSRAARSLGRLARTSGALLLLAATVAVPVRAAGGVDFGTPEAKVSYNDSIEFTVPITTTAALDRAELWLRFPGTIGPFVTVVPTPGTASKTLTYRLDLTGEGHIVPNTDIVATWAAYPAGSSTPVLSAPQTIHYRDTTHDWKSLATDLVTVHWYDGTQSFGQRALDMADQSVRHTASFLGVEVKEPIDFYIYADQPALLEALGPGTREWVGGTSRSDIRTLFALIGPNEISDRGISVVVPHELVHLVFDSAVDNPFRGPPLWLNEGLAMYLSEGYTADSRSTVESSARSGELIPFRALSGSFPTDSTRTHLAYAEVASAVDYMVRTYGPKALVALATAYKDGPTDDEAFTKAFGVDLGTFQAGWLADLGATAPSAYGPQPNPTGPVPPGWGVTPPSPAPGATPAAGGGASPSATAAPAVGASPAAPAGQANGPAVGRDERGLALAAVVVVVIIVFAGLLVARRRTAGP